MGNDQKKLREKKEQNSDSEKNKKDIKFPFSLLLKNWGYKLLALVGAIGIWAYVINVQNPQREKKVDDIQIYVRGEESLRTEEQLVLATKKDDLGEASVLVSLPALSSVNKNALSIFIDVSGIKRAGEYELPVQYESSQGKIVRASPESITVEVDQMESKEVPIQIEYKDEMPEGYWHGTPSYTPTSWTLQGPGKAVEKVQKAVFYVSLNRTTSYQDSLRLLLLDEAGEVVDSSIFTSTLPSVVFSMKILPKKTVPIQYQDAVIGTVPDTYEIKSITAKPSEVTVAAPQEQLDQIDSLDIETINIGDGKQPITRSVQILKKFSDIELVEGERVEVHVEIVEKSGTLNLVDIPISVRNLERSLEVYYQNLDHVSVEFQGPNSQLQLLKRENVKLYVDCKDLTAGSYQLPVQIEQPDNTSEIISTFNADEISINLRVKE